MPSEVPSSQRKLMRRSFLALGGALLTRSLSFALPVAEELTISRPAAAAQPIQIRKRRVYGALFYQAVVDLADPNVHVDIGLANRARRANSSRFSSGAESFPSFVARMNAALVINGTFFGGNAEKWIMGNMLAGGRYLKYAPWEDYGTTLGIGPDKRLHLATARVDGKPPWPDQWFSITAGPRLLREGKIWLAPRTEGFTDRRVLGVARRTAIGFPAGGRKMVLVTFLSKITLTKEAQIMRAIGCSEAINLDGGSSTGLAHSNRILVPPSRQLTNVIAIYDNRHPATTALRASWSRFRNGERQPIPRLV